MVFQLKLNEIEEFLRTESGVDFLWCLANHDAPSARAVVGEYINTPQEILEKLSKDPESSVRRAVASNPGTKCEILKKLANDEESVKKRVASNPSADSKLLYELSNDKSIKVRAAVASNPNTSQEILEVFYTDVESVRISLATNPNISYELLERLLKSASKGIMEAVASNPKADSKMLKQIATSEFCSANAAVEVIHNPNVDSATITILAKRHELLVLSEVVKSSKVTADVLDKLSGHGDEYMRRLIVRNTNTSIKTFKKLINVGSVQTDIAENTNTPPDLLDKLARIGVYNTTRKAVAENPNTKLETLYYLLNDKDKNVKKTAIKIINNRKIN